MNVVSASKDFLSTSLDLGKYAVQVTIIELLQDLTKNMKQFKSILESNVNKKEIETAISNINVYYEILDKKITDGIEQFKTEEIDTLVQQRIGNNMIEKSKATNDIKLKLAELKIKILPLLRDNLSEIKILIANENTQKYNGLVDTLKRKEINIERTIKKLDDNKLIDEIEKDIMTKGFKEKDNTEHNIQTERSQSMVVGAKKNEVWRYMCRYNKDKEMRITIKKVFVVGIADNALIYRDVSDDKYEWKSDKGLKSKMKESIRSALPESKWICTYGFGFKVEETITIKTFAITGINRNGPILIPDIRIYKWSSEKENKVKEMKNKIKTEESVTQILSEQKEDMELFNKKKEEDDKKKQENAAKIKKEADNKKAIDFVSTLKK